MRVLWLHFIDKSKRINLINKILISVLYSQLLTCVRTNVGTNPRTFYFIKFFFQLGVNNFFQFSIKTKIELLRESAVQFLFYFIKFFFFKRISTLYTFHFSGVLVKKFVSIRHRSK